MKNKFFRIISTAVLMIPVAFFSSGETKSQQNQTVSQLGNSQQVVSASQDTMFKSPYVDVDEWRDTPVRHHYIHGGFKGTGTRFSFYFPPKEQYQGRFFQYITPFPDNENLTQSIDLDHSPIASTLNAGAYFIETNGGGKTDFTKNTMNSDPTIGAYRANAASAQFSREVAIKLFGGKRPYGYCYGGSGGAYRTIGAIENTKGVWDGGVPIVMGSPMAMPNVFSVRMHAMRILRDKFPQIVDALEPGGSGDMYVGLNKEERDALEEVTKMGFPPKSWYAFSIMGPHGFTALYQGMKMADAKYFELFWTTPGYLGFDNPGSFEKFRIQKGTKIKKAITIDEATQIGLIEPISKEERGSIDLAWKSIGQSEGAMPKAFQMEDELPVIGFLGGDLIIKTGAATGKVLQLIKLDKDKVVLGPVDPATLALVKSGDEVQVDNSAFLAAQTYHRHQVPKEGYSVWDQFRDKEGKPIYPQRPMLLGPLFTRGASGVIPNGDIKSKVIVLESLWDREAFPWQADWYRHQVQKFKGDSIDNYFRLWYTDHALHGDYTPQDVTHAVSYDGVVQQALKDLSAWVEKGIEPAPTTSYKIVDGQVVVPSTASERKGIQPIIELKANGGARADVKVGQPVTFTATVDVPANTGKIVAAEWDFEGTGEFQVVGKFKSTKGSQTTLKTTYKFSKPGTYFPVLRVASQREGDAKTPYTRIKNLGRVRVVVK